VPAAQFLVQAAAGRTAFRGTRSLTIPHSFSAAVAEATIRAPQLCCYGGGGWRRRLSTSDILRFDLSNV